MVDFNRLLQQHREKKEHAERNPKPYSSTCKVAISVDYLAFLEQHWHADTLTTVIYSIKDVSNYGTWKHKDMHRLVAWNGNRRIGGIAGIMKKQEVGNQDTLGIESLALQGNHPYHYMMFDIDTDKTILQGMNSNHERLRAIRGILKPLSDMFTLEFTVFSSSKKNYHVVSHNPVEWKDYKFAVEYMGRQVMIDPGYLFHTLHRHSGVVRISGKNGTVPSRLITVKPTGTEWQ